MKVLVLFICSIAFFPLTVIKNNDNAILWTPSYKLSWADFQGMPDLSDSTNEQSATKTRIEVTTKFSGTIIYYYVSCFFEKESSWTLSDRSRNLLEHEQLHFDISEIFARELRKKLKEMKNVTKTNIQQKVKDQYHDVITKCVSFQHQYDQETDHSRNHENQQIWNEKVKDILQNTKEYSSVIESVDL